MVFKKANVVQKEGYKQIMKLSGEKGKGGKESSKK